MDKVPVLEEEGKVLHRLLTQNREKLSPAFLESRFYQDLLYVADNPEVLREAVGNEKIRVFVWLDEVPYNFPVTLDRSSSWSDFLGMVSSKCNRNIESVYNKSFLSRVTSVTDIKNNDHLLVKCKPGAGRVRIDWSSHALEAPKSPKLPVITITPSTSTTTAVKTPKGKAKSKDVKKSIKLKSRRSSSVKVLNSFSGFVSNIQQTKKPVVTRRNSDTEILRVQRDFMKESVIYQIRDKEKSIGGKKSMVAIDLIPGTAKKRNVFRKDLILKDLKRSKSEPDVLMYKWNNGNDNQNRETLEEKPLPVEEVSNICGSVFGFSAIDEVDPLEISPNEITDRMSIDDRPGSDCVNENHEGEVQAGKIGSLIKRLANNVQDPSFCESFLLTYDHFMSHYSLLTALILIYRQPVSSFDTFDHHDTMRGAQHRNFNSYVKDSIEKSKQMKFLIQHRIIRLIQKWISMRYSVLKSNRKFILLFQRFCDYLINSEKITDRQKCRGNILKRSMRDTKREYKKRRRRLELSRPIPYFQSGTVYKNVLQIKVVDLARQLTLGDQYLYNATNLLEYQYFLGKEKEKRSTTIIRSIDRFNTISYWVATSIILCGGTKSTPEERGRTITYFISVMEELRKLKSYNPMMQIYSALHLAPVRRLEKSWCHVDTEHNDIVDKVTSLLQNNCKGYRQLVDIAVPPCIPIQEILLRDLVFIHENQSVYENGWINFSKFQYLAKVYNVVQKFQKDQYNFKSKHEVQLFLESQIPLSDDELYTRSREVEPSISSS